MSTNTRRFILLCAVITGFLMISFGCIAATPSIKQALTLVKDGQPTATIVLAKEPNRAAVLAAADLQEHIRKITGAKVPVVTDDRATSGVRILVGESAATRELGLKSSDFKTQEYLIRTYSNTLVLMGRDKPDLLFAAGAVAIPGKSQWLEGNLDDALQQVFRDLPLPTMFDEQATCYAVYDFLERYCGVRWFNPTDSGTIFPQTKTLTVNVFTVRRAPAFAMRIYNMDYGNYEIQDAQMSPLWPRGTDEYKAWETAAYSEIHKRVPDNGQYEGPYGLAKRRAIELFMHRMRRGGEQNFCNHSFYGYYDRFWRDGANKSKFFVEKRPEYFAQGYEGSAEPPQLCYTNRSLILQVAADARAYYDGKGADIGLNKRPPNMFEIEPMDNIQFCKCLECQKWYDAEEGKSPFFSNGQHSDYFFNFVNEVARELHKTHPDKYVSCLAYMSHAAPPERVKLEPNVSVQFCFACNRLVFDRQSYEHELKLLDGWGKEAKTRPVYLWLYPLFPYYSGLGGKFNCFPGFYAHALDEQFKLFYRDGYRGMFHCGDGQEVETYVTDKLMDDPTLNVDQLLADYFQGLYGAAAGPMKQMYLTIEKIYCDPKNYPPEIATGKLEGHHHQTEEMAWGWLGTEPRMKELAGLMEQARAAASTEMEKHRVALFDKGIWQYMLAGRRNYAEKHDEIAPETSQKLPNAWKMMLDPTKEGIQKRWFDVSFDVSSWKKASVLECLENQGYKDYKYAWYRTSALIPKEREGKKVILYLGAVDERCQVWINGNPAGEYNGLVEESGWERPVRFDVTKFVRLGESNQITVLVQNDYGAGGIWKASYIYYRPLDWNPVSFKVILQP